jgi:hypothetical protein
LLIEWNFEIKGEFESEVAWISVKWGDHKKYWPTKKNAGQ